MANSLETMVKDPIKGTDLNVTKDPVKYNDFAIKNPQESRSTQPGSTLNASANEAPSSPPRV